MIVIVRRRLRHSLVQRCGRSVRQCSLSCDTTVPRSTACCCLETDTTRPWAEWSSPSTRRRPVHLQVQVLLHATITQTWSPQTERVKKGAYTIPSIHTRVVVVQFWQVRYLCILAPSSTSQPPRRASRCHFCLQHHTPCHIQHRLISASSAHHEAVVLH